MPSLFLLVPVLVLALFSVLLYRRLVRAPRYRPRWLRLGAAGLLLGLGIAVFVGFAYQNASLDSAVARLVGVIGMTWLATAFYLLIGILLGTLVALGLRLARRSDLVTRWHRRSVPVIVTLSLVITGYGLIEARQLRVTEQAVTIPGLAAAFDGYRVAVVSDLHVGPTRGADLSAGVVELTNGADPDVVLVVGDLTDGTTDQFGEALAPLDGFDAPDGVFAVTGNHEYYAGDAAGWVERWRDIGITPLLNEASTIHRGGATLRLAGVSDTTGSAEEFDADDPGLRADLAIHVGVAEDALVVPTTAVKGGSGTGLVWLDVDGVPEERAVELGMSDGTLVQVLSGLSEGDLVRQYVPGIEAPNEPVCWDDGMGGEYCEDAGWTW